MSSIGTDITQLSNVTLTFDRDYLTPSDIQNATNFPWLLKYLHELAANFSKADIHVDRVRYSGKDKIRHLDVTGTYIDSYNEPQSIFYTINADAVDVISLFKLTGIELAGGSSDKLDPIYAILMVREPRIAHANSFALELPGGSVDPGETFTVAGRRELVEETIRNEIRYRMPPLESFEVLGQFRPSTDATRTEGIVGVYSQLNWANPAERHFVRDITASQGGLASENEHTKPEFVSIERFLKAPNMAIPFRPALETLIGRIALKGDAGPRDAYQAACRRLGL